MMGKCLFQCPRIKRIHTTMNWLFIVTHKLVSMFLLEIPKQQNHKCLCHKMMIIKFIYLTIHCFLFCCQLQTKRLFNFLVKSLLLSLLIQQFITLIFLQKPKNGFILTNEFKVIILFGYIFDVSWYSNTFLNIQAQTIKEVRDEEKWSSIFLYI